MREFDVLVVGGGPAGSTCARALARRGLRVGVLDRARFPRDKVCAGWITPAVVEELGLDLAEYAAERVLQPIRGFRVALEGGPAAEARHREVVSYAIRRCEFDEALLRGAGAELLLGEGLRDLAREGGRIRVNGRFAARVVVGAGGHFCPVARWLGARPGEGEPAVVAREVEFPMEPEQEAACPVDPELPELFFARDLRGYGWVVRKGRWLNVGIGRQDAHRFPERVDAFLDFLERCGRVPPGLPRRLRGHAYLLYEQAPRPLGASGVLLVGDAAGLAYNRSGEGIRPAVESGLLAARVIAEAGGRVDDAAVDRYRELLTARFGERRGHPRPGPTDWLPAAWRAPVVGWLLGRAWFARPVVVDRWFLHRHVPPLPADGVSAEAPAAA